MVYTVCHSQQYDQGLHYIPFSAVWSGSTLLAILSKQYRKVNTVCHSEQSNQGLHCLLFSAVWSVSTLFAILSLISVYTIYHSQPSDQGQHYLPFFVSSMTTVYTIRHSQHSDQGLHNLPFSAVWSRSKSTMLFSGTVWSGSTLFAILSSLSWSTLFAILSSLIKINDNTVILRNSLIRFYTFCHSQKSHQGLHYLRFFLSSIIKVSIVCHSQQSDQGLHYLPFSAVWSRSTVFDIQSSLIKVKVYTVIFRNNLIRVYTICHSKQSDLGPHCLPFSTAFDQGLYCLPFSEVWSRSRSTLSFSGTVWLRSTLFAILSSLIRVYTIYHSQQSDQGQGLHCHSLEQSD